MPPPLPQDKRISWKQLRPEICLETDGLGFFFKILQTLASRMFRSLLDANQPLLIRLETIMHKVYVVNAGLIRTS